MGLGALFHSTVTAVLVGFSQPANFFHENSAKNKSGNGVFQIKSSLVVAIAQGVVENSVESKEIFNFG